MSNLEELGQAFRAAANALDAAQSAVHVARDQHDGALAILARVSDGSSNTLITDALSKISQADAFLDQAAAMYALARESVDTYIGERGI